MSQESINLLIGGIIAIAASSLTTWLSHLFQVKQENKKREWELTNRKYNERREIIKQRIGQIELYITKHMQIASNIIDYESEFGRAEFKIEIFQKFYDSIIAKLENIKEMSVIPYILKNQELIGKIESFRVLIIKETVYIRKNMSSTIQSTEFIEEDGRERIQQFMKKSKEYYREILSMLDEILINQE